MADKGKPRSQPKKPHKAQEAPQTRKGEGADQIRKWVQEAFDAALPMEEGPERPTPSLEGSQGQKASDLLRNNPQKQDTPWVTLDKEFYWLKNHATTREEIVRSCELIRKMFLVPKRILRNIDELLLGDVTPERVREIFWYSLPSEERLRRIGYNMDALYPEAKPCPDEMEVTALQNAIEADPSGFDLRMRDKNRQELIEYLSTPAERPMDTLANVANQTIYFVHDMEKVLMVKLWEVVGLETAWGNTCIRAQALIAGYSRYDIKLPKVKTFCAHIIVKNFSEVESSLSDARMELALALQELTQSDQASPGHIADKPKTNEAVMSYRRPEDVVAANGAVTVTASNEEEVRAEGLTPSAIHSGRLKAIESMDIAGVPIRGAPGAEQKKQTVAEELGVTAWHELDVMCTVEGLCIRRKGRLRRRRILSWERLGLATSKKAIRLLLELAQGPAGGIANPSTGAHRRLVQRLNGALGAAIGINGNAVVNEGGIRTLAAFVIAFEECKGNENPSDPEESDQDPQVMEYFQECNKKRYWEDVS